MSERETDQTGTGEKLYLSVYNSQDYSFSGIINYAILLYLEVHSFSPKLVRI